MFVDLTHNLFFLVVHPTHFGSSETHAGLLSASQPTDSLSTRSNFSVVVAS